MQVVGVDQRCRKDRARAFRFNVKEVEAGGTIQLEGAGEWAPVKEDYLEGCAKLVGGDYAVAVAAFDKALVGEPGWHRVKLLRAAALALSDAGQRGAGGKDALAAVKDWPGDHLGWELAIAIGHLGGQDVASAAAAYVRHMESHRSRDLGRD